MHDIGTPLISTHGPNLPECYLLLLLLKKQVFIPTLFS